MTLKKNLALALLATTATLTSINLKANENTADQKNETAENKVESAAERKEKFNTFLKEALIYETYKENGFCEKAYPLVDYKDSGIPVDANGNFDKKEADFISEILAKGDSDVVYKLYTDLKKGRPVDEAYADFAIGIAGHSESTLKKLSQYKPCLIKSVPCAIENHMDQPTGIGVLCMIGGIIIVAFGAAAWHDDRKPVPGIAFIAIGAGLLFGGNYQIQHRIDVVKHYVDMDKPYHYTDAMRDIYENYAQNKIIAGCKTLVRHGFDPMVERQKVMENFDKIRAE